MAQRAVHNTHRWTQLGKCKGCGCDLRDDQKATQKCPKPYRPSARRQKEYREP